MSQTKAQLLGPVLGDVNYDSGTFFVDSANNRIGIGTTAPDEKLQVAGTVRTVGGYLKLTGSATPDHENYIQMAGNGTRLDIGTSSYGNWNPHNGIDNLNGPTHMSFTTSGNVGVGITNPGNKFVVNGYIQTPNNAGGLDIGYKRAITITGTFAANTWYNTGFDRFSDTGIFIVTTYFHTFNAGGQSYDMRYTGMFCIPSQYSNSGDTSLITLHRAGHAPNAETLQLRTLLTPGGSGGGIYLQWLSNAALTLDGDANGKYFVISLHRLSSGL